MVDCWFLGAFVILVFIGLFSCYVCFVVFGYLLLVIDCSVLLIVLVYALLIRFFGCFALVVVMLVVICVAIWLWCGVDGCSGSFDVLFDVWLFVDFVLLVCVFYCLRVALAELFGLLDCSVG